MKRSGYGCCCKILLFALASLCQTSFFWQSCHRWVVLDTPLFVCGLSIPSRPTRPQQHTSRSILPGRYVTTTTATKKAATTVLAATDKSNNSRMADESMKSTKNSETTIRGVRYADTNSTIPTATEVAEYLGVRPPLDNASTATWKRAWTIHRKALPWLHRFDTEKTSMPDSKLSLMCLWWKAMSGNNPKSPVYDNRLHYDLLPPMTRRVVEPRLMRRLYPRLHHSNVEIRTAFLDSCIDNIVHEENRRRRRKQEQAHSDMPSSPTASKFRLITLGGGYDLRSIKFLERGTIHEAYELDLPAVIDSKSTLIKERLRRRRPWIKENMLPTFYKVDLNDINQVKEILTKIMTKPNVDKDGNDEGNIHTIFMFEAVMIYLDEGVPTSLLELCRTMNDSITTTGKIDKDTTATTTSTATTLCFADRLENIPGGDLSIGQQVLTQLGWQIVDWKPKPGLARHMGMAVPIPR